MSLMLNKKMQAIDKAVKMFEQMQEAAVRPDKAISGETLNMYKELVDWGFLEKYPIIDSDNKFLYVTVIAMHLSKDEFTLQNKSNKSVKSKWEMIQEALDKNNKTHKKK